MTNPQRPIPRSTRCPTTTPTCDRSLPDPSKPMDDEAWKRVKNNAQSASDFLKALSHEGRLMILCSLAHGEKSVTELEQMLSSRQAAVSQQLARLRQEKLISARREGKQIFYSLTDDRARRIIEQVYELFCK
jgi:DNA-binding transcriptional ArsR family regulator